MNRYDRILNGVGVWASYYKANPQRFAADYLHLDLKLFQKILLFLMRISTVFVYIAARGQGKSFICAVYCVWRAVLFPRSKIVLASGTRGQAINILEKIYTDIRPNSPELALEIDQKKSHMNGTQAVIWFRNNSFCKVVTAGESARSNRAHVLILDEARLLKLDTIQTILRKFLSDRRSPTYSELTKEERKKQKDNEPNQIMYFSSGYFQEHWLYQRCKDTAVRMLKGNMSEYIVGFPWQLSVTEGLLYMDDVEAEMTESTFTEVKWAMEMEAIFWGEADGSFFDYNSISKNRHIKYPMYPEWLSSKFGSKYASLVRIPPKQAGELRIISADIALMSSKKHNNDATAIFINQMAPAKSGRYTHNIVYADSMEGLRTEDQALVIRRMFDEYDCDYIVLDANGIGLGVFDCLARDLVDPDTGEQYPALSCYNDQTMADRCTVANAPKVIWSIKASAQMNNDCAVLLREGFRSGRLRLLINEYDGDEILSDIPAYNNLNPPEKLALQMPYINTTLLIDEIVKLQYEEANGKIKISERAGMRKDRYSSLSYNYYVATQLESRMNKRNSTRDITEIFVVKPPTNAGKAVNGIGGKQRQTSWRN